MSVWQKVDLMMFSFNSEPDINKFYVYFQLEERGRRVVLATSNRLSGITVASAALLMPHNSAKTAKDKKIIFMCV